ncbi:hypothetical protein TTHERM_00688590 (macronuclear) [Tetrahymena thermophila SB210]|uniref:Uncharacterized protein n=1 Tax=Tetrahymena thermophila (strain SB210) TaxID=312017 RepID=I7MJK9_TETTS|nr:hypothetical protein TTHERM_00688590 [Tetrahymena thermophila SB210]EAS06719.3 hypothetical protein TTHERM_00688590 [Tetrahymena thermophila SB210]|eukprot:XP_001026961.3 hypothetical protein TTHERM_00688590 [Tetrahymena thermophila SB210]
MSSQNQFIINSIRQGLNSSLRDHNNSKSVSNQTQQHKSGKSRHFGVLQQLKKREEDWNDRFYVQQIPIFKQQSAKSNLRVQSTKVSVKNSNNASKLQENNYESIRIRRITQDSVVSIQRPSTSQFQYQVKQNENNNGVVNKYIKELQNQGVRPPSVNYSTTHPHGQLKQAVFHENASSIQQSQIISEETIKNLKIQINNLWEENNIPDFHRVLYVECTKQFKKKQFTTIIQQEIQSLKERKSFIQICLRALRARQQCLKTIREYILQEQENQQNLSEQSQHKFGELIVHLRILTLNIVESILRWRDYLSQLSSISSKQKMQNLKFLFQGENYLLTLQNDYSFICDSYLKNYFSFWSSTSDPFFLATQSSNNSFICNNPIKSDVLQRIRASELILLEEKIFAKLEIKQNELLISPLGLFEDEAEDFLSNYLKEIPLIIKNSFVSDAKQIFENVKYEQELNWVKISTNFGKLMQGLCIFYVDKNCFTQRRIVISHVSSINQENFQSVLQKFIEYIWSNDYTDEIRITLHYQYDENKDYKINAEIQNSLKSIGFKWKQMQSEKDTGLKSTIFGLNRPQTIQKGSIKLQNQEPISYKQLSILQDKSSQEFPNLEFQSYDQSLLILGLLQKSKCSSEILKAVLQSSPKKKQQQFVPPGTKEEKIKLNDRIREVYDQIFDQSESSNAIGLLQQNTLSDICFSKLCYRWLNFHTFQLENYNHSYIRIKIDEQNKQYYIMATSPLISSPIYLIPTDDKSIVAFIINLKGQDVEQIKQGKLCKFVNEIINSSNKDQVKNDELWIPTFKKSLDFHNYSVDVQEESDTAPQIISKILVSTSYIQPIQASLQIKQPSQEAYIFQAPFLFGLIKADDVDIPLFSSYIEECDLI